MEQNDLSGKVADLSSRVAVLEGQVSDMTNIFNNFNRLGISVMALGVIVGIMVCVLMVLWFRRRKEGNE